MRPHPLALLVIVAATGCAADGGGDRTDDPGSAVIVTTVPAATGDAAPAPSTATTGPPASDPTASTASSTPEAPAAPESSPPTIASTTPPSTSAPSPPTVGEPVVATEPVGEFDQPVDLAVRPGDDAFYVVQQPGTVVRFDGSDSTVVLDVADRISTSGNEQGLLGLAFSPEADLAYANYTRSDGATVIAEYPVSADGALDVGAERVVLTVDQPYSNHNGGDLLFGPDGMLFVPLGDGGAGGDPERRADDPQSLLGSLLRIDPTPQGDAPYTIPPDNPFADGGGAPEVWSYGLRNPWKVAFDPVTAELWIADVGQNEFEEVNRVAPIDGATAGRGANFGWSAFEGTARFNTDVDDPGDTTMPVLTYRHGDDGCSVSGGAPYRGTSIAELEPAYVYSDFCSGKLWALDLAGGRNLLLLDGLDSVSAVRQGPDGELYVLERSGSLVRLVPG